MIAELAAETTPVVNAARETIKPLNADSSILFATIVESGDILLKLVVVVVVEVVGISYLLLVVVKVAAVRLVAFEFANTVTKSSSPRAIEEGEPLRNAEYNIFNIESMKDKFEPLLVNVNLDGTALSS